MQSIVNFPKTKVNPSRILSDRNAIPITSMHVFVDNNINFIIFFGIFIC